MICYTHLDQREALFALPLGVCAHTQLRALHWYREQEHKAFANPLSRDSVYFLDYTPDMQSASLTQPQILCIFTSKSNRVGA